MPIPVQLNLVEFSLRGVPANLPEHERERLLAETTISYGAGLFRLLAFVSRDRVFGEGSGVEPDAMTEEEFDDALNIAGNLGTAIVSAGFGHATAAFDAYEKLIDELTERVQNSKQLAAANS